MGMDHFNAMVAEMLMCRETANTIQNLASAIIEWHRCAGLQPPFQDVNGFARIMDTVVVAAGRTRRPWTPITKYHDFIKPSPGKVSNDGPDGGSAGGAL